MIDSLLYSLRSHMQRQKLPKESEAAGMPRCTEQADTSRTPEPCSMDSSCMSRRNDPWGSRSTMCWAAEMVERIGQLGAEESRMTSPVQSRGVDLGVLEQGVVAACIARAAGMVEARLEDMQIDAAGQRGLCEAKIGWH